MNEFRYEPRYRQTIQDTLMEWRNVFKFLPILFLIFCFLSCASKEKQAEKHFKAGFGYQDQGNLDKAIEEYKKATELNPNHLQAHMNLGTVYIEQKKYDQAIDEFNTVVKLNYYWGKAHYNLGYIYLLKGEKEKAQEELKILKSMGSGLADRLKERMDRE
jgi:tetratricopeptide (TPR) repeat protein